MGPDLISAWASLGTAFVIGASAIAALIQLRHMRAGNQLEALLSLERDFRAPDVQAALRYIQAELPERMQEPRYRSELETIGYVDPDVHSELIVCNWFNEIGTLVKHRLVSEDAFMDLFARLIVYCWRLVGPAVAVMRRTRGDFQYHDFEYLALRAQTWLERHPRGIFPLASARKPLSDPWKELDKRRVDEVTA